MPRDGAGPRDDAHLGLGPISAPDLLWPKEIMFFFLKNGFPLSSFFLQALINIFQKINFLGIYFNCSFKFLSKRTILLLFFQQIDVFEKFFEKLEFLDFLEKKHTLFEFVSQILEYYICE